MTAYFGLFDVGALKGNALTFAGHRRGRAVGSMGRPSLAKIKGCTVIGIAVGPERSPLLTRSSASTPRGTTRPRANVQLLREVAPAASTCSSRHVCGDVRGLLGSCRLRRGARVGHLRRVTSTNSASPTFPEELPQPAVNHRAMEGFYGLRLLRQVRSESGAEISGWLRSGKLPPPKSTWSPAP